jgi:hypothetical protein
MNYTSIENIIFACYSDLGVNATDENHKRYFNWLLRGYKQLRLFKLPLDKAETLPVQTGIRCVILPKDYVSFVAIGKIENNQLVGFSLKGDLIPEISESCGVETQANNLPEYRHYGRTDYTQGGGRNLWYYRPDEGNNRILIDGMPLKEATLFYKSTGINLTGETLIPTIAEETLISWVHYQQALGDGDKGMIQIRKQILDSNISDLQLAEWDNQSMIEAVYSTIYQGVKR